MSNLSSPTFPTYIPSGKLSWQAPLKLLLMGVPVAIGLAWVYALCLRYSPATIVSVFALGFFSVMLGILACAVLRRGHSRSRSFNRVAGGVLGFVFLWAHWFFWIRGSFDQGPVMASHFAASGPLGWVQFLGLLADRLQDIEPHRFMVNWLPLWWGGEAALLICLPASLARSESEEPYSELAKAWATKDIEGELWSDGGGSAEFAGKLAEGGAPFLVGLPRAIDIVSSVAAQWWTVSVVGWQVASDPEARWLDVGIVIQTRDDSGKVKTLRQPVVLHWRVSALDYERLAEHLRRRPEPGGETGDAVPTPLELVPAVEALQSENYPAALRLAESYVGHHNSSVRADALRVCALSAARLEDWAAAFEHYHALFERESSVMNALQLATTSVMLGELARGKAWFEKAAELNTEETAMPWPQLHTNFLSALGQKGEYAAGLSHIEWLRDMFMSMSSTDDNFVFMHGMPFLSVFFEKSLPFLQATLSASEVRAWYEEMRPRLDASGQSALDAWLPELSTG